ncbi:EAL domain-containing protein (putative c-di-GMP-specific phosphodiesterase class I) [Desulfobotulus alkaliphilus]|uniref:EAL domain-containing protein (Putative c-di-GMP-specific phosphodiesterase class I) n=1 Tax=Desulfobotulus alkaliphilus TaxID=622671 RepID=A0A562S1X4_9BACT|nr:EAL domain-containing protein [Desulfobotulus alkaliphilus]TWI75299.1 EAL domain-containing protein (putative c-di-GMP-specific phosphodiesterase class I) [Desulfobotulus alkaliphilus]
MFQEDKGPESMAMTNKESACSFNKVASLMHDCGDCWEGYWAGHGLGSVFQPVYSLAHKRIVGFEALIRPVRNGLPVAPPDFFKGFSTEKRMLADRLCRALHVANFQRFGNKDSWLFLNVATDVAVHARQYGPFFSELLDYYGLSPESVVIEVVEQASEDPERMDRGISFFRDLGCLIAMDDFGAGSSNFERIWRISPHIVKLDRTIIARAGREARTRRMLPGIISLLHQTGALVLVEGIEREEEARIAMESDADMVQGYYFGRPEKNPPSVFPDFDGLMERCKTGLGEKEQLWRRQNKPVLDLFSLALEKLCSGLKPEEALKNMLKNPRILRCYLLTPTGLQVGATLTGTASERRSCTCFAPLQEGRSGDWFRRPYFKRALRTPGRVRVTQPYRSITGDGMCQTLSCYVTSGSESWIVCCDLCFNEAC